MNDIYNSNNNSSYVVNISTSTIPEMIYHLANINNLQILTKNIKESINEYKTRTIKLLGDISIIINRASVNKIIEEYESRDYDIIVYAHLMRMHLNENKSFYKGDI